jgi:hypothetical protein
MGERVPVLCSVPWDDPARPDRYRLKYVNPRWQVPEAEVAYAVRKLMARGKEKENVVTAIGRELLGFIWAIAAKAEAAAQEKTERRAA